MSNKQVIIDQRTIPIYLTSACCEDTGHGTPEVFEALKLNHGYSNPLTGEAADNTGEWYPLTAAESMFIGEDVFLSPAGEGLMGYSVLYRGQKWLFPSVEICYDESSNEENLPSSIEAEKMAVDLLDFYRDPITAVGGSTCVQYCDGCDDRHTVSLLVPFSHAMKMGTFSAYKKWLESLGK